MDAFDLDRIGGRRALSELVDEVLAGGEEALRLAKNGAGRRFTRKPDRSPVTEADHAIEERLRAFCARRFPDVGFVGEEAGESGEAQGLRFVVDPIDGTRAFVRGIPTWSTLVGLEADGEPVLGIAFMPAVGDLFVGVRGDGATGNGRPLRVSGVAQLEDACICHGGLDQLTRDDVFDHLRELVQRTYTQRGLQDFDGYRHVLWGRADAMIDPGVAPWDMCAPAVLIREAGGRFTDMNGDETIHGRGAVASNGLVHDTLVGLLRSA